MFAMAALGLSSAAAAAVPTFTRDVAPILFKHCGGCHGSMLSYDAALPSAKRIGERVRARTMPPWPADPSHSLKFRNDPRLSEQEIAVMGAWVDGGAARGDAADLPRAPDMSPRWLDPQGRAPDAIVSLPEIHVGPRGEVPYIQQLIKVPFGEDKWIAAMQLLPGNRQLLHHMGITEVALPEGMGPEKIKEVAVAARTLGFSEAPVANTPPAVVDPTNPNAYDMLAVYTPGTTYESFGDDSGKLLKGGGNYYINFNIHYTTTGKPEADRSRLGLWFRRTPPAHQLIRAPMAIDTIIAEGQELLTDAPGTKAEGTNAAIPPIPAYASSYEVMGISAYVQPVTLYQLQPHAHMRAKDFTYTAVYPDGRTLTILTVPSYDFHWQLAYQLDEPLALPPGSKLIVTAHYDNSQKHYDERIAVEDPARNCGPEKVVYFRRQNQSWDEMFSPLAQYAVSTTASKGMMKVVRAVGCLDQSESARWRIIKAGDPTTTKSQATSVDELKLVSKERLGVRQFELVGADVFNPRRYNGHKVAAKGVLIPNSKGDRINVTSLQPLGASCE